MGSVRGKHETFFVAPAKNAVGAALLHVDLRGCVQEWSLGAENLFGYSAEDAVGMPLRALLPFLEQYPYQTEGWCDRADGRQFRGEIVGITKGLTDANDKETALTFYVVDRSRHEVTAGEAMLQAVLEAAIDGILAVDTDGRIVTVNRAFYRLLWITEGELVGRRLAEVIHFSADRHLDENSLHNATARRVDGALVELECKVSKVDLGSEIRTLLVLRDVAERRLLQRQILDVSEQLRRQIGQDLHDDLGQLLTGTAFLAKGLVDKVDNSYREQASRVVDLVNQAISRVRALSHGLSPIHVEAQRLVGVMANVVAESAKLLNVECIFDPQEGIESDRPSTIAQLCLIVREAITNAVRHGRARRVLVRLEKEEARRVLVIEDDGSGISRHTPEGDGLGLRSMRQRAHQLGGDLDVSLNTHGGTVVRCYWSE